MAAAVTGAASPILLHLLYHSPFGSHSTHHHQHFQPQSHMLPGSPYRSPQQQQRSGSSLTSPSRAVATLLHGISPSNRQRPATSSQAFVEAALSMSNDAIEWDDDVHYGVAGLDLDLDVGLGLDMDLMNTSLNASQGLDVSLGDIDLLQASTTAHVPVPVPQPSTVIHVPHQREEQLQAALHAALELSQAAETAMREMAAQLAMSKEQVALYQSSIQSIRALQTEQARKADEDLEQAELEIAVLKAAIGEALQLAEQTIGQHEQEIALQKAKAQQNQTLLQLAEQTIGQHEQEMTAQAQQQQTLRQTILQAEQTIAQRENELTAQAQQILVLKQTVGQPEQEIALLKAKAQQADLENQTLRTKTQQADQANKALKQTIDQLEQEIARLKSNAQHAVQVQTLPHQQGRTNEFSDMEAQLQEALTIASELSVKLTEREDEVSLLYHYFLQGLIKKKKNIAARQARQTREIARGHTKGARRKVAETRNASSKRAPSGIGPRAICLSQARAGPRAAVCARKRSVPGRDEAGVLPGKADSTRPAASRTLVERPRGVQAREPAHHHRL